MKKTFALNTEPHIAEVGDHELRFQPEVLGDEFLDAYSRLQDTYKSLDLDLSNPDVDLGQVREATVALRLFLASLMLPESAEEFARWDIVAAGKTVSSHGDPAQAREAAGGRKGARVVDRGLRLPDRVLIELMEWVVELYGGQRPPTSSSGSATASPRPGTPGRATSRSKA
ncbi:hypothetical protein AB0F92_22690 [Kitasatospora aureofaciens]|uniref:hypothetical protein n=1 Tax=Kitasatospora aureofaciens TaxID=1894 RepID=UPI00092CBC46|nr:hypothetical protein CP971_05540 [Streptomyces viridifaciens]UKZ04830.1 hypothetical protein BOQ63_012395 [Streptomyces viridifaciens]